VTSNIRGNDGTKEFALYVIEVKNTDSISPGWIVTRRYSEFLALHQLLRAKFLFVQQYELPKKAPNALLGNVMRKSLADTRQEKLGKYLSSLCSHQEICDTEEFRRFICQEQLTVADLKLQEGNLATRSVSLMKNLQKRFATGMDVFSQASFMETVSSDAASTVTKNSGMQYQDSDLEIPSKLTSDFGSSESLPKEDKVSDVICELFIEVFDLKEKANWFRRQAAHLILNQIFGDTIDR
jgi:hypothetical protein